jgi:queuine/archaeosine tRNA-ribosyltransferase
MAPPRDLFSCPELAAEFGVPEGGKHPKLRLVALLQAGMMRWKAAAIGGYHDGENTLPTSSKAPSALGSSASPIAASSP